MSRFRTLWTSLALTLGLIAFTSTAMAKPKPKDNNGNHYGSDSSAVPEIDPSSMGSALALLGFGATMLLDSRRRK